MTLSPITATLRAVARRRSTAVTAIEKPHEGTNDRPREREFQAPSVVVATAGYTNTGASVPIDQLPLCACDLCRLDEYA